MPYRHSGACWVERNIKFKKNAKPMSDFGRLVADVLGQAFLGIYHISERLNNVDWSDSHLIRVPYQGGLSLATTDDNELTRLVVLAHDACVRFSIEPCNMRYVYLVFTSRKRTDSLSTNHPTLEDHAKLIRDRIFTTDMPFPKEVQE